MTRKTMGALACGALLLLSACATQSPQQSAQAETRRRLGHVKLERGELERAIREYTLSLELAPKDPETHFGIAEAYRRKGALELAEQHLLEAIALAPDHHDAHLNLSVVYLQQGRFDAAAAETTWLLDDHTFLRPVRALVNRGWAHYKSGRLELAEADFLAAIEEEAVNFQARINLGIVRFDQGRAEEAVREFEKALEVLEILGKGASSAYGVAEAETNYRLARAYDELGNREKARAALRRAVEQGGDGEWGERSREYLAALD